MTHRLALHSHHAKEQIAQWALIAFSIHQIHLACIGTDSSAFLPKWLCHVSQRHLSPMVKSAMRVKECKRYRNHGRPRSINLSNTCRCPEFVSRGAVRVQSEDSYGQNCVIMHFGALYPLSSTGAMRSFVGLSSQQLHHFCFCFMHLK